MEHQARKDTRKRAASKREDEVSSHRVHHARSHTVQIPTFVKPNATSNTIKKGRPEVKDKKSRVSSDFKKSNRKKRTSRELVRLPSLACSLQLIRSV